MLQQILQDMFIDPEILSELDEDQKQVLFCKMREEQVRRWKENVDKLEAEEKKHPPKPKKAGKKGVDFLLGGDSNPWVWVMGEHTDDQTVDEILEDETQTTARREADVEAERIQQEEERMMQAKLRVQQEAIEAERRQKEVEHKRKAEEAARLRSMKEAQDLAKKIEEEKKQQEDVRKKKLQAAKGQYDRWKRTSISNMLEVRDKKEEEIYSTLRKTREKITQMAEEGVPIIEKAWKEQEKKSKQADAEKRALARKAREEHRISSLITKTQVISAFMDGKQPTLPTGQKPALSVKPLLKPRASKPASRAAVISWYQELEEPKGSGLDPLTDQAELWFHGIIGRLEAESLLEDKKSGSFMIRVSEKVYGYAVSLKTPTRCKHFLIDVSEGGYKFFGTNQLSHTTLAELITFYKTNPISSVGQEKLLFPCGQTPGHVDTTDLFSDKHTQTSYL